MEGLKYNKIIISFGDQKISCDTKQYNYFLENKKYVNIIFKNYHYEYVSPFSTLFYRFSVHDLKYFVYDKEYIIYCLISVYNLPIVDEIDNNFLINELDINFKYFNIKLYSKWSIDNIINSVYDKNIFKIIIYYEFPNIYEFEDNDIELKSNRECLLFFKKIDKIYLNDLIKLASVFNTLDFCLI
jgi:hypothetical protein